jgi:hypothetical protein
LHYLHFSVNIVERIIFINTMNFKQNMNYFIVILTLATCFFIPPPLYAQAPGYLGKRLSIHTDWNAFPALGGPTAGNKGLVYYGDTGGGFAFNWRVGAAIGYTISRKQQLRLLVNSFKTGLIGTYDTPSGNDPTSGSRDLHELFFNLDGFSVGIGTRAYNLKKSGLAPLGIYNSWSLLYTQVKGKILDKRTTLAQGGPHSPLGLDLKTNIYSLGYSFGRTQILADRFLIDYGVNLNFDIPITYQLLNGRLSAEDLGSTSDYVKDNNRLYDDDVSEKIFGHSLFFFHIGIGFLID